MKNLIGHLLLASAAITGMAGGAAQAAIQLSSTRVIMNEGERHASVFAKNLSNDSYVVQAWIDGEAEEMDTPFFITPPLSRFDGGVERRLDITRVAEKGLPGDRESYYWINVLEIPQKKEAGPNNLVLTTRTRIKLFYRPVAIQKMPRGEGQLKWAWSRNGQACTLSIDNTSAYTVNFARIDIPGEAPGFGRTVIARPLDITRIPLGKCPAAQTFSLTPSVVNDYGVLEVWPQVAVPPQGASDDTAGAHAR